MKRMRGKRKIGTQILWMLEITGLLLLCGCGASSSSKSYQSDAVYMETTASETFYENGMNYSAGLAMPAGGIEKEEVAEREIADSSGDNQADTLENPDGIDNRKLIKTVDLSVETKQFDAFLSSIQEQVSTFGGYIEQSNVRGSSYQSSASRRYANLVIRIPIAKVDSFVGSVSSECNVLRKSEYVEDVTLRYTDLESRKKALKVEQERLIELLAKAESMDAIISIEERLSDIRYELENYESQLRVMDNQVAYSTVSINIEEAEVFTPVTEDGFWTQVEKGFQSNLKGVGLAIRNFLIWFFSSIPLLLFWGVIITVIVLFCILVIRKNEEYHKKHDKMRQETDKKREKPSKKFRKKDVERTEAESAQNPAKQTIEDKSELGEAKSKQESDMKF